MNKRIRELAKEAGMEAWPIEDINALTGEVDIQKFAQLIIAECCTALHPMLRDMISRTQAVEMIARHFGDEE